MKRPILAPGICGGKSSAVLLRCFYLWTTLWENRSSRWERSSLVNTFGSWTRFLPLRSEKTDPFWIFVSCNCLPFMVFPINRVSAPFIPRLSAMSSRTNDPVLHMSSMAYLGSSLSLDPDINLTGAMGTTEAGSCAWAALQLAYLNSESVGVLRMSLELSSWNLVGWWREHVLDVLP